MDGMPGMRERVCPVEHAGTLDGRFRRWMHDPDAILRPHLKDGMRVLDVGCGPGYFSLPMARLVGPKGFVCAADLQQGMLDIVRAKIDREGFEDRVRTHLCGRERIGVEGTTFDRVLLFWMLHEVPRQREFLAEIRQLLAPGGQVLLVEPWFHVSGRKFAREIGLAEERGFASRRIAAPFFSRAVILE